MQCKWKWLQNKKEKVNNQPEIAVVAKVTAALALQQYGRAMSSQQRSVELAAKNFNNQPEAAMMAKLAPAVVAWRQLPCKRSGQCAVQNGSGWGKNSTGSCSGDGGVAASLSCDIVTAVCSTKWKWLLKR